MDSGDGNIKVVVRCRPLNSREIARGAKGLIRMQGNQTFLDPPDNTQATGRATERKTMAFSFDKSYWSAGPRDEPGYCSQETLYDDLGKELLDHGFGGFNACILAYGQTGSGKSYSMMGYGADKGIIPLTCSELFVRTADKMAKDPNLNMTVEVSYIEIYNEKVRDLLNPKNKGNLKVREHPSLGPYVEDLSRLVVANYDDMMNLMDEGNKARTIAATNMNETSSRSHAVFTLILTQKRHDAETNLDTEKVSRISLVDLAGSERANSTGASGVRLKEGANINKSLTTLGKVISALALASDPKAKGKKSKDAEFIPYRDSVLTWLLKDSLGGNSKTAMIAAISPADYDETLSTLRYADQAKKIKNKAVVNEDPNAKLVRELKEELEMLRARVSSSSGEDTFDPTIPATMQKVTFQAKDGTVKTVTKAELQEQLESSEKLMQTLNETWEEKLSRTQEVHKEREKALEELGITVEKNNIGVHTPKKMPHLVNLNEDPLMSECLIYQLKTGTTVVGQMDSDKPVAIRLSGNNILEEHCYFENNDGVVYLHALPDSITLLNGKQIPPDQPQKLRSGYRIILGDSHVFRFTNPEEVRKQRYRVQSRLNNSISASDLNGEFGTPATRPTSPGGSVEEDDADWTFAQREAALARLHGLDPGLESLPDEDLNKLFDRITKLKSLRDKGRPESSLGIADSNLSMTDDVWSDVPGMNRAPSDTWQTDDTSLETASPEMDDTIRDVQGHLDATKLEYENRINAMQSDADQDDLRVEKEHMEVQLKMVQNQMKKLLELRSKGAMNQEAFEVFEPTLYTVKQLRMIRRVLDRWRSHRSFSMAEKVLSGAVLLKEANVISKELREQVSYNFTIVSGGSLSSPASAREPIVGLAEFGDVSDPVLASTQPYVGIKVLDKKNNAIYIWSMDKLNHQIQRMRNLTSYIDRPAYSRHFSPSEPFYDNNPPAYSFVGSALVSLATLSRKMSSTAILPIFCRYTAEAIGSCRVDIKVPEVGTPQSSTPSTRASSPMPSTRSGGTSKLNFFFTVDSVKGLSSIDFSALHCQIRLSSFTGSHAATQKGQVTKVDSETIYTSSPLDMEKSALSELKFRKSFIITVNNKVAAYLRDGYAPIEFYAVVRPTYLERLERWDELREHRSITSSSDGLAPPPQLPPMRRSETDFVVEQNHDVVAWGQVSELGSDGEYSPVPVFTQGSLDPGAFCLHQGLQRRVILSLTSNSGKQLPWAKITRMSLGNVRLLDEKGRIQESLSKDLMELKLMKDQKVEFKRDGTGYLSATALWDSGVHDSILLNRVTPSGQRVLLQLGWYVDVETCADPVLFSMDIAVSIMGRDARPPSNFLTFMSSNKVLSKTSAFFSVKLVPPLTRSAKELWRLDTSEKYVKGEDVLGTWKARGVSVVEDFMKLETQERKCADVQAIRAIMSSSTYAIKDKARTEEEQEAILRKSLELWQRKMGHVGKVVLSQEPAPASNKPGTSTPEPLEPLKLVGTAKIMARTDTSLKKGHLMVLVDAKESKWERRWFVLRRPFLYIYKHSNELEETGIISLSGVKVETNPDMEILFARKHTFTLFTASNSYALAAPSAKELQQWLTKLDPTRIP